MRSARAGCEWPGIALCTSPRRHRPSMNGRGMPEIENRRIPMLSVARRQPWRRWSEHQAIDDRWEKMARPSMSPSPPSSRGEGGVRGVYPER